MFSWSIERVPRVPLFVRPPTEYITRIIQRCGGPHDLRGPIGHSRLQCGRDEVPQWIVRAPISWNAFLSLVPVPRFADQCPKLADTDGDQGRQNPHIATLGRSLNGTRYCGKPNIHVRASCHSRAAGGWLFREDDSSLARSQTPLECDY